MPTIGENITTMSQIVDYAAKEPRLERSLGQNQHPLLQIGSHADGPKKEAGVNYSLYSAIQGSMNPEHNLSAAINDYSEDKQSFEDGLRDAMDSASKTSSGLKGLDYKGGKDGAGAAGENASESSSVSAASPLAAPAPAAGRTREIHSLIQGYNDTVNYLHSHMGISAMFDRFADKFGDSSDFMQSLDDIGISTDITGELSVNESELEKALAERPDDVEDTLSQNGLAGRIDRNVELSSQRADQLYPPVDSLLGQPDEAHKGMYSHQSRIHARPTSHFGKFMDMYY